LERETGFSSRPRRRTGAAKSQLWLELLEHRLVLSATPPPPGLIAWWPGDGNTKDIVGQHDGTLIGGSFATGEVAQAFTFDGVDDSVQVANNALWNFGSNGFSTDMWVNFNVVSSTDSFGHPQAIFMAHDEGGGDQNKWTFCYGGGDLYWHINSPTLGPIFFLAPYTLQAQQWYNVAVTGGGGNYTLYVNGQSVGPSIFNLDGNPVSSVPPYPIPDANAPLTIGEGETNGYMNGFIDEAQIYNRGLTAQEVLNIFNAGSSGLYKGPVAGAGGPYTIHEGDSVTLDASATLNPLGASLTYAWDINGAGTFTSASGVNPTLTSSELNGLGVGDEGTFPIAVRVTDNLGNSSVASTSLTVLNAPFSVGAITAPLAPQPISATINTSANFTDPGVFDTHNAVWNWGDGTTSMGAVSESNGSGTVSGSHTFTTAGIYTLTLTVTDNHGASGQSTYQFAVIYDPSSFASGGGWFSSAAGAYVANTSLAGNAFFGFGAAYLPGLPVPLGQAAFAIPAASFAFASSGYDWLVVTPAETALHGKGTVNGKGNYGFFLAATDPDANPGGVIDFRERSGMPARAKARASFTTRRRVLYIRPRRARRWVEASCCTAMPKD
jgi:hypothetical protein